MSRNALFTAWIPRPIIYFAGLLGWLLLAPPTQSQSLLPVPDKHAPVPTARVIIVQNPDATRALIPVPEVVHAMVDKAIKNLTGKPAVSDAWRSLVSPQDVVGLKVYSGPGANSGTRPDVVAAVVEDLLVAGVPPRHIIVWDKRAVDLRLAGFFDLQDRYGIRVEGVIDTGYDSKTFYETALLGSLNWTDLEFGQKGIGIGRKSYVSKMITRDMTKMINITPLMHHNLAGVSGNLYGLALASVDNTARFESDADAMARAVPEIYALPVLGDRVVLNIVDALICQYEGQQRGLLHYSIVLNELRFSRDPVALDVLSLEEIGRERQLAGDSDTTTNSLELYNNAALLEIGVSDLHHIHVERLQ